VSDFQEIFNFIDFDKDGTISKNDLRATYDAMGKVANEKDLDDMLSEGSGSLSFSTFLALFGARMGGNADDDDVIVAAIKTYDTSGKIDADTFRHSLITFGDKFSAREADDAFDELVIDNQNRIDTGKLIGLFTSPPEEEEEEE